MNAICKKLSEVDMSLKDSKEETSYLIYTREQKYGNTFDFICHCDKYLMDYSWTFGM